MNKLLSFDPEDFFGEFLKDLQIFMEFPGSAVEFECVPLTACSCHRENFNKSSINVMISSMEFFVDSSRFLNAGSVPLEVEVKVVDFSNFRDVRMS